MQEKTASHLENKEQSRELKERRGQPVPVEMMNNLTLLDGGDSRVS